MRKQYLYAISYWCTDKEGHTGQSCTLLVRPSKINSIESFNAVSNYIINYNNLRTIAICNIMLLGKVKA